MIRIEIITIGSEILAGHQLDTNFQDITKVLCNEGLLVSQHTTVPDEREALGSALSTSLDRSSLVIMTGGLGATPDDVTRRVMASVMGRKLIFRQSLLDSLREKYAMLGKQMSTACEAMALVPAGAQPLNNSVGIAPGLFVREDSALLFVLPGVPAEMVTMLREEVVPFLRREALTGTEKQGTLRTIGLGEVPLADLIHPMLRDGINCSFLPDAGRIDLRFWTRGGERFRGDLDSILDQAVEKLGPYCYARGETTLEQAVLSGFSERGYSLALAESVTGGLVGSAITSIPGSSRVFQGSATTYSNLAKQAVLGVSDATLASYGAVSEQTAREMAVGARRAFDADVGLSTTGIAGPGGGTAQKPVGLVYFGLSSQKFRHTYNALFNGDRHLIQRRAVTMALNMLRLLMMDRLDLLGDSDRHG